MTQRDIDILRGLAKRKKEIASMPIQKENIKLWTNTNDLKMTKAPIYINEICWNEFSGSEELELQCEDSLCRQKEEQLRQEIYCWNHMPGNMVVTDVMPCELVVEHSGYGIHEESDLISLEDGTTAPSRHFHIQIRDIDDIDRIMFPRITYHKEQTNEKYEKLHEIFGDILRVEKTGWKGEWFTPWDNLIRLTGVSEALMDLIMKPEYIKALVKRWVDVCLSMMKQCSELGIWASNNDNTRVGSGGYGYTGDLEPAEKWRTDAPLGQLWGCSNAQIFSDVSPQMHWDFSLQFSMEWLKHFGLNYYGCCEPLHLKSDILRKIPNLRKVSASPWADIEMMRDKLGDICVLSVKPNPAIFVTSTFDEAQAKREILAVLEQSEGANIELIMKDISTLNHEPERLWRWAQIAQETVDEYYG
ncbi:MAG: hypothetical protein HN948_02300 [Clostridia bacterium]|jgi:hypothetical protein|nr:hypothetical protein [Clostridia bacterium]MBT7121822.1 hypothetical protein [Clostridia bacterium]